MSLFCAGWTVGSVRRLAEAGASSLTYYETTGWRGLMEKATGSPLPGRFPSRPGVPFPVYHVFADLAGFAGAEILPVEVEDPLSVEALALREGRRLLVLAANLTGEPRRVSLRLPGARGVRARLLDGAAVRTSHAGDARREVVLGGEGEPFALELPAFAVARLDGELA
jgi:hypothetical protein